MSNGRTSSRWRRLRLAVPALVAAGLLAACAPQPTPDPTPAGPTPDEVALERAGNWVLSQFNAEGFMPDTFTPSNPDVGNGVVGVADLAALGIGSATASDRLDRLESDVAGYINDGTNDVPAALARVIMAVVANGGDPRDFAGTDLVARLEATIQPDGFFGTQFAGFDGAFRQGLSLAALSLVSPRPASITPGPGQTYADLPAVAWLFDQQCDDGSWLMFRTSTVGDCVEDPGSFTFKDSNGSAMVALGLTAIGAIAPVDPTGWFASVRGDDKGWGSFPAGATTPSDADSTGLVIAALEALGHPPDAAAYATLRSFQIDDSAPMADRGAFQFNSGWTGANRLATTDAITALFPEVWPGALVP